MPDVTGIDHIFITASDIKCSMGFYDSVMGILGFRKNIFTLNSEEHIHYFIAILAMNSDPDGIQLEITNYRQERRERHDCRE